MTPTRMRSWVSHTDVLALIAQILEELLLGLVGKEPERQLAQSGEVVGPEVVGQCLVDLLGRIDVAVDHPPPELLGRGVDQLDLVGLAEHPVGHPLADRHLDDPLHGVGDALQVLDVDRRDDVDSRRRGGPCTSCQRFSLATRAGHVGVGELVHQDHLGMTVEHRVEVHLLEVRAPVLHHLAGDHLEVRRSAPRCAAARDTRRTR